MSEIHFKPIGQVKTQLSESDIRSEHEDLAGELEIYAEFEPALEGIDGYSHLFVLGYFNRLKTDQIGPLQVKPRRLVNRGFKARRVTAARCLRTGFADTPQSDRAYARSLARAAGSVSQSQRARLLRRYAHP